MLVYVIETIVVILLSLSLLIIKKIQSFYSLGKKNTGDRPVISLEDYWAKIDLKAAKYKNCVCVFFQSSLKSPPPPQPKQTSLKPLRRFKPLKGISGPLQTWIMSDETFDVVLVANLHLIYLKP